MNNSRWVASANLVVSGFFTATILSGCGSGASTPPPVISVGFSGSATQTVAQGQSVIITAIVSPATWISLALVWWDIRFGGEAAIFTVEHPTRFKAAVIIEGVVTNASVFGTDKAVLIPAAGREQWSDNECALWGHLRGSRFAVNLLGADHLTPSDAVWLAAYVPELAEQAGPMGPQRTVAAVRSYIAAFLDANLRGRQMDPLLSGPSSKFPDAVVTTQEQALCRRS